MKVGGVAGSGAFNAGTHTFFIADLAAFATSGFTSKSPFLRAIFCSDCLAGKICVPTSMPGESPIGVPFCH